MVVIQASRRSVLTYSVRCEVLKHGVLLLVKRSWRNEFCSDKRCRDLAKVATKHAFIHRRDDAEKKTEKEKYSFFLFSICEAG